MRQLLVLLFSLVALASGGPEAFAREEILRYHTRVEVLPDGWLDITEEITVRAEGKAIVRGIYRDFPTRYRGDYGTMVTTGFDVQSVTRDERPVDWFLRSEGPGRRLYIGDKDTRLKPGTYSFRIRYRTPRQIAFFDDRDELYFNIIGPYWDFPILEATASVVLPAGAKVANAAAYRGPVGSTNSIDEISRDGDLVFFRAGQTLNPGDAFAIVVDWPAGYVYRPQPIDTLEWFLRDNAAYFIAFIGLFLVAAYYWYIWDREGRDPRGGPIIAAYEPPDGVSAAASRFLLKHRYDNTAFTAAIIALAVKGWVEIDEPTDDEFVLLRSDGNRPKLSLSKGEQLVYDKLMTGRTRLDVDQDNHKILSAAQTAHSAMLDKEHHGRHFRRNFGWVALGLGFSAFFIALSLISMKLFSWPVLIPLTLILGLNGVFYRLMRQPTLEGRKLMDLVEGFKRYLSVAEKDRLNFHNPPNRTPELFEKYLPYAIALDVDHEWGEQFDGILGAAGRDRGEDGGWQPSWYHGRRFGYGYGYGSFSNSLSSGFSAAYVAAATAPSSSGSSGFSGGFSGGGGGGGGGGGW